MFMHIFFYIGMTPSGPVHRRQESFFWLEF